MAAQKKRPAAASRAFPPECRFTAPDGAQYVFMTYDKGKPTERIAICEWCGAKRGCQILQVAGKGLAEEARVAIARELMDMLVAGTPLADVKARTVITITPLSLWCYTELGQGRAAVLPTCL